MTQKAQLSIWVEKKQHFLECVKSISDNILHFKEAMFRVTERLYKEKTFVLYLQPSGTEMC